MTSSLWKPNQFARRARNLGHWPKSESVSCGRTKVLAVISTSTTHILCCIPVVPRVCHTESSSTGPSDKSFIIEYLYDQCCSGIGSDSHNTLSDHRSLANRPASEHVCASVFPLQQMCDASFENTSSPCCPLARCKPSLRRCDAATFSHIFCNNSTYI